MEMYEKTMKLYEIGMKKTMKLYENGMKMVWKNNYEKIKK